jgi:hypothetical protein
MAAAAAPSEVIRTMEALFRPTTRYRDLYHEQPVDDGFEEDFTEVELLPHLTLQDVLATGITWEDFCLFFEGKVVWMAPGVLVCSDDFVGNAHDWWDWFVLALGGDADTRTRLRVYATRGTPAAAATVTCDFLLRLLGTCEQNGVYIRTRDTSVPLPISGAALSRFFGESQSCLRKVTFQETALSEDLCLALTTMPRLDVVLSFQCCSLADDDAAAAFVECLQGDKGPIELNYCEIGSQIIANALRGNCRVTRFKPGSARTNDADTAVLFRSLVKNRGLVDLDLSYNSISNENFVILCESLKAHPTLTSLDVQSTRRRGTVFYSRLEYYGAARMSAMADMMEQNTILQTIHLSEGLRNYQQIYTQAILPYLETNLHRPRVLAVKKTTERPFREKVLGRALYCVSSDPNLVWMFLSENVDAFVRSEEEAEGSNSEVTGTVAAAEVVAVAASVAGSKRKRKH